MEFDPGRPAVIYQANQEHFTTYMYLCVTHWIPYTCIYMYMYMFRVLYMYIQQSCVEESDGMSQYGYRSIHTGKHWEVGQSLAQDYDSRGEYWTRKILVCGENANMN